MVEYPITPDYLRGAPGPIVSLYAELEDELIKDICERLPANEGEITGTVKQHLEILKRRGYDTRRIAKKIAALTGQAEAATYKAIEDAITENESYYRHVYEAMGREFVGYDFLDAEIEALKAQTMASFRNLAGSYGFSIRRLDGTVQWMNPSRAYQAVLDKALFKAQSGMSYSQCIRGAVSELTSSGITTVEYYKEDGVKKSHTNKVDVAVRRALMTGITQISRRYTDAAMDDLDTDYLIVTQHKGARDKDGPNPWSNHESWQGKIYSKRTGDKYPSVYEVCGLDEVDGLCGVNCRHCYYPYFEGISPETAEKMAITYTLYNNKRYSDYEASQVMRKAETQLRELKRRMIGDSASGDRESYLKHAAKHRDLKAEYLDFAKATGNRSQYYERAGVLGWGPKEAKEAEKALQAAEM